MVGFLDYWLMHYRTKGSSGKAEKAGSRTDIPIATVDWGS